MSVLTAALKSLEQAVVFFEKDLEALSEEQILNAPMGSARKPVDFVYETALVNLQIRARIVGETPPQGVEDGWEVAPAELCSKAAIAAYYKSSSDALLESIRSIPVTDGDRLIPGSRGDRPLFEVVYFIGMHNMYHDAQLNYVQELNGDLEMHWF